MRSSVAQGYYCQKVRVPGQPLSNFKDGNPCVDINAECKTDFWSRQIFEENIDVFVNVKQD